MRGSFFFIHAARFSGFSAHICASRVCVCGGYRRSFSAETTRQRQRGSGGAHGARRGDTAFASDRARTVSGAAHSAHHNTASASRRTRSTSPSLHPFHNSRPSSAHRGRLHPHLSFYRLRPLFRYFSSRPSASARIIFLCRVEIPFRHGFVIWVASREEGKKTSSRRRASSSSLRGFYSHPAGNLVSFL